MTTKQQNELAEQQISLASKKVKADHLNHHLCLAAIRGAGSCQTFADRYRMANKSSTKTLANMS
jgi:hypothetical protein